MYNIGDSVAHPLHGAGIIDGIEERKINGRTKSYYILKLPSGGMVVMIPTDNCEAVGVRPIVAADAAETLINEIPNLDTDMTSNWSKRYRENMERLKSGDLFEVARVIKGLTARDSERGLSTGERKMLQSAKQILVSEIALSQSKSAEEVALRIDAAFA
ncbi:MAG: CarD family transcriptional regulator [Oscillospiraceae bacterium]|jgi:CarD family transcriptional regulator|nr:CarD family transcriptional regulator [Oscillospiraceae bacterium]